MSRTLFLQLREAAVAGAWREAAHGLEQLDRDWPQADVAALLAWIALAQGDSERCQHWLAVTFAREPAHREALTIAVDAAMREGRREVALARARELSALDPDSAVAQYNLGAVLQAIGDGQALAAYDRALALDPALPHARLARAWLHFERGTLAAAADDFARACAADPRNGGAQIGTGACALRAGDGAAALAAFVRACDALPDESLAWRGRADALELLGDTAQSLALRRRAVALAGAVAESRCDLAMALSRAGEADAAHDEALAAAASAPSALLAQWLGLQLLPIVYRDADDAQRARAHWREGLDGFAALELESQPAQAAAVLTSTTSFFRHYLGDELLADQRAAGSVIERLARAAMRVPTVRAAPRRSGRLRIGFASAHLIDHTVARLFGGFMRGLDRDRFEVVAVHLGRSAAALESLRAQADWVLGPHYALDAWVAALEAADLDALIWLDIGMDGTTQALSALRFAPLQCALWGHPVTTGLTSIDVFISAAGMEPPQATSHYSERLLTLPGIGLTCATPQLPVIARPRARDAGRAPTLLCAQSVYKLTPVHDALFARVLAGAPDARLVLTPAALPPLRERLLARMQPVFQQHGIDFERRVLVHQRLDRSAFQEAIAASDLVLDSIGWSGGQTSLEALSLGVPVLTLPGPNLRARHTLAMLECLGLGSVLVAIDPDDYVKRAAALATNADARADLAALLAGRKAGLFDDPAPLHALQDFLWRELGR